MAVAFEMVDVDSHLFGAAEAAAQLTAMDAALEDMHGPLEGIVHDMRRHALDQFESRGEVSGDPWPALDESTLGEKIRAGYPTPDWPLVATGALLESATSPVGPYGFDDVLEDEATLGLDWERDGWQIPVLHQEGVPWETVHRRAYTRADGTPVKATSYLWHLPARPIFTITEPLVDEGADRIVVHVFQPFA